MSDPNQGLSRYISPAYSRVVFPAVHTVRWNTIFENVCRTITLRSIKGYLVKLLSNNSANDRSDSLGIAGSVSRKQSGSGLGNRSGSDSADRLMTTARLPQDRCENRSRDRLRRQSSDIYTSTASTQWLCNLFADDGWDKMHAFRFVNKFPRRTLHKNLKIICTPVSALFSATVF